MAHAQSAVTVSVTGTVVGSDAVPIAGATIEARGATTARATSSADGAFSLTLPPGVYTLVVTHAGNRPAQQDVAVTTGLQPLSVTLETASLTTIQRIGSTVATAGAAALNNSPAAVSTLTSADYRLRGQNVVQNLLEELPGVELTRASSGTAPGANTNVAIRGADPYETQTLVDGHPINGGASGTFLIQFLNPQTLGTIEVSKGPGYLGNTIADSIGGTVNFRTPPISSTLTGRVAAGYDTYNGSTYALEASDTVGKFGFLVAAAFYGTPGYNEQPIPFVVPDANAMFGVVPNATINALYPNSQTYDNRSQLVKLAYNFTPSTVFTAEYFGGQSYVDYTGTLTTQEPVHVVAGPCVTCGAFNKASGNNGGSGLPSYTFPGGLGFVGQTIPGATTLDNFYLGNYETDNEPIFSGELRTALGPGTLLARYYTGSVNRLISDPGEASQVYQCDDPTCNFEFAQANGDVSSAFYQKDFYTFQGEDFEYDLPLGASTVTAAFDSHNENTQFCSGPDAGALPCGQGNILTQSRTISLRGDIALTDRARLQLGNYFSSQTGVASRYDPHLGFTYRVLPTLAVRLAAGTDFAAPYPDLVTHTRGSALSLVQAGLTGESSFGYNVGLDGQIGGDAKVTLDAYNTTLHGRFATVNERGTPVTYNGGVYNNVTYTFNQANTRMAGIEATFLKAPKRGVGAYASGDLMRAYTYGTNFATTFLPGLTPSQAGNYGNEADGAQIVGYPYFHGRGEVNYTFGNSALVAFGADIYGAVNSFNQPGFTDFDAHINLPLQSGFRLNVAVQNLFNHDDYRTYSLYAYGYAPPQDPGVVANGGSNFQPQTLFFAPPRQITFELSHPLGK